MRVRAVPKYAGEAHANAATGAFGGAPMVMVIVTVMMVTLMMGPMVIVLLMLLMLMDTLHPAQDTATCREAGEGPQDESSGLNECLARKRNGIFETLVGRFRAKRAETFRRWQATLIGMAAISNIEAWNVGGRARHIVRGGTREA
eukprot:81585-Pyramimonas_sp.AAC.2